MTPLTAPWEELDERLRCVIAGEPVTGTGWAEIAGVLASYQGWKCADRSRARLTAARLPGPLAEALCRWYDRLEQADCVQAGTRQAGENR